MSDFKDSEMYEFVWDRKGANKAYGLIQEAHNTRLCHKEYNKC